MRALLILALCFVPALAFAAQPVTINNAANTNTATVDSNGDLHVSVDSSGTGSNVNITGINGAPPSITNPIWIANAEAPDVTGTLTAASQTVQNASADGYATGLISIHGTYSGSGSFVVSDDGGTTFYPVLCARSDGTASETGFTTLTNTSRMWVCPVSGNDTLAVQSTGSWTGTANVRVGISEPSPNSGVVSGSVVVTQPTAANLNATVTNAGTFAVQDATTETNTGTVATAQGAQGTGLNPPTGGTGVLGFLSGIFNAITNTLKVQGVAADGGSPGNPLTIGVSNAGVTSLSTLVSAQGALATNCGRCLSAVPFSFLKGGTASALPNISDAAGDLYVAGPYAASQTALTAHSGNAAASTAAATLTGTSTTTVYISGFQCTGGGATLGSVVNVTVTGPLGGTMTYSFAAVAGVLLADAPLIVNFNPAVPASAVNTTIVVSMPSLGTGNTNASCNAQGFYQ